MSKISVTGWRVAMPLLMKKVVKGLKTFLSHAAGNMAAVSQYAALAAITGDQTWLKKCALPRRTHPHALSITKRFGLLM